MNFNSEFTSTNLQDYFHKIPFNSFIEKEIIGDYAIYKQTLDIFTDDFNFCPVAYTSICIPLSCPIESLNSDEYHFVDSQFIDFSDHDLKKYLTPPFHGRVVNILHNETLIGDMIEFVSEKPSREHAVPALEYIHQHLVSNNSLLVEKALFQIKEALEAEVPVVLKSIFPQLPDEVRGELGEWIEQFDHIAITISSDIPLDLVDSLALRAGFKGKHRVFPSTLVAKELGELVGKTEVPTTILKARGETSKNKNVCIEIFAPHEKDERIQKWISETGTHVAFKAKSLQALRKIQAILNENNIRSPQFLHDNFMENNLDNISVIYFELPLRHNKLRVECCYYS